MNPKLLDKMADIINSKSKVFYAVVPRMKLQYMNVDGDSLQKTFCYVLNIVRLKQQQSKKRNVWNIYEIDIEKVIQKISQRDRLFADRITRCDLTPTDVEIIIRRASFRALNLKISPIMVD
jgi:hypothetical protein